MSARPRIIGVNSLPAADGLRAMPSSAAAAARPWPSAPPKAAMPMPRPAASAMYLSRSPHPPAPAPRADAEAAASAMYLSRSPMPPAPASWANAEAATSMVATPAITLAASRENLFRMRAFISVLLMWDLSVLFVGNRALDVDHRKQAEHQRLDD